MICFLKPLEMSPFHWGQFCRCAMNRPNRLGHALPHTRNILTNSTLIPKIYSACSFMDATFSYLRETYSASCLSHMCRALPRANLHISVFHACAMCPKVATVSSGTKAFSYSQGKMGKAGFFLFCFVFHER